MHYTRDEPAAKELQIRVYWSVPANPPEPAHVLTKLTADGLTARGYVPKFVPMVSEFGPSKSRKETRFDWGLLQGYRPTQL